MSHIFTRAKHTLNGLQGLKIAPICKYVQTLASWYFSASCRFTLGKICQLSGIRCSVAFKTCKTSGASRATQRQKCSKNLLTPCKDKEAWARLQAATGERPSVTAISSSSASLTTCCKNKKSKPQSQTQGKYPNLSKVRTRWVHLSQLKKEKY